MRTAAITALTLQLVLVGCDFDGFDDARLKEDFHYTYKLQPGGRLELESFNGSVEITGWDQDSVDISGTKYAPNQDLLDALKVDVVSASDSIRIRSVRPNERRGNMGVKYVISVPRKTLLERVISSNGSVRVQQLEGNVRVKTSNGSVRIASLKGDLDVNTSNGSVELNEFSGGAVLHTTNGSINAQGVRGFFDATTSNGSIDAHIARPSGGRPVRASSTNGKITLALDELTTDIQASTSNSGITVKLPGAVNARLKAHTSNSNVHTDFDVAVKGTISKNNMDGTIGSGGPVVDLSTSNGAIRIQKM
jgi:DUF4097 and DUF4098 domain-containing protein YvlB